MNATIVTFADGSRLPDLSFLDAGTAVTGVKVPLRDQAARRRWDNLAATAEMTAVDDHVERSGVSGLHPDVQAAVVTMCDAYYRRDTAGFTAAVAEAHAIITRLTPGAAA